MDAKYGQKLPKNTYYILILGCRVETNRRIPGKIADVLETGCNDVYIVQEGPRRNIDSRPEGGCTGGYIKQADSGGSTDMEGLLPDEN